jgi:hypothetical protein
LIAAGHDFGTSVRARLLVTPGTPGSNGYKLQVADYDTGEPVDAAAASLRFQATSVSGVAPATIDLVRRGPGAFEGSGAELSIDGIWTVTATITQPGGAVEVPILLATRIPGQPVDELVSEGLPTIYVVDVGVAGTAQVYLDPGRGTDPDQLHVTFFDAAGSERPVEAVTVLATTAQAGEGLLLAPRQLEPGHFVASVDAVPSSELLVDVVTSIRSGTATSHLHLRVTIDVPAEVSQ